MYVAIDFETCGKTADAACSVGLVRISNCTLEEPYYTLLRPPSPNVLFTHIHGLTWQDLKDAPPFAQAWEGIANYCQGVQAFIAHNAPFDRRVLTACLLRAGLGPLTVPFLCTLKGARKNLRNLRSHGLAALCQALAIPLDHHNAASDAIACARIFLHLKSLGATDESMLA